MRRVVILLLAAGLVFAVAHPASATPTSSDPKTAAADAAAWVASQVNSSGFIPLATDPTQPNLSVSVQAVTALASAAAGKTKANALLAYLGAHVDDFVMRSGEDVPGEISLLVLDAVALGQPPTSFGPSHVDLVSRLLATQQPSGLFGALDPTFDGAFRQGLSLMALHAVGMSNEAGVAWLEGQQCADGMWTPFRADTATPCPPVDPINFTGPDTNSTALALLGLHAQGATSTTAAGATALLGVRNSGNGWGFLAASDQSTDANSTGLVLSALIAVNGSPDGPGTTALLALQAGCDADPADRGGIAFQPGAGGQLVPDAFATVQATPALAEVELPMAEATMTDGVPTPCAPPPTTIAVAGSTSTSTTTIATGSGGATTTTGELPLTGGSSAPLAIGAVVVLLAGVALVGGPRRRRP